MRTVVVILVSIGACKSSATALPAKECPDPCCGGSPSIDCAENPNVSCVEDADPCTARAYGCTNGSFYLRSPTQLPVACSMDEGGTDLGGLVLGDGSLFGSDDSASDGAESDVSIDAPADAATE
jgi:hypothetical protein